MTKSPQAYFEDILESIELVQKYVTGKSLEQFRTDKLLQDGIIRRMEIIGEAVKHVPQDIRVKYPEIPWRDISGMRNFLIHEYFGVNLNWVWETIKNELPELEKQIRLILYSD